MNHPCPFMALEPRHALSGDLCQVTMGSTDSWDPKVKYVIKGVKQGNKKKKAGWKGGIDRK